MEIETRDFGVIEIEKDDVITFVQPVFGFDNLKQYVILYNQVECPEFAWLQSVEDKDTCFVLADPRILKDEYKPALPSELEKTLGEGTRLIWLMTVVQEDFLKSTVNLRSPIIVNTQAKLGTQIILDGDYPIRQPII